MGDPRYDPTMHHHDKPALTKRLNRIEGQVRGVSRMVEDGRYCIDILTQVRAIKAALGRFENEMLKGHLSHCVENAIVSGDPAEQRRKIEEIIALLDRVPTSSTTWPTTTMSVGTACRRCARR